MRQRAGLSSESVQRSGELIGRRPGEVQVVSGGIGGRRRKEPRSLETGGFEDRLDTGRIIVDDVLEEIEEAGHRPVSFRFDRGAVERGKALPWCITLDNSKGISRLRFWAKNRRVNGINDLPVFMHQGTGL